MSAKVAVVGLDPSVARRIEKRWPDVRCCDAVRKHIVIDMQVQFIVVLARCIGHALTERLYRDYGRECVRVLHRGGQSSVERELSTLLGVQP